MKYNLSNEDKEKVKKQFAVDWLNFTQKYPSELISNVVVGETRQNTNKRKNKQKREANNENS